MYKWLSMCTCTAVSVCGRGGGGGWVSWVIGDVLRVGLGVSEDGWVGCE
jgi:hypothetical protein